MTTTQKTTSSSIGQPGRAPSRSRRYANHTVDIPAKAKTTPSTRSNTAAGVSYREFSNLNGPLNVVASDDTMEVTDGAEATGRVDLLVLDGAKALVGYDHPFFGRFAAVVTHEHGAGRITTVGTIPDPTLAADLLRWLVPAAEAGAWDGLPASVTVHSATNGTGERIHVVHNWSWTPQHIRLPRPLTDVLAREADATEELHLSPWGVRVMAD